MSFIYSVSLCVYSFFVLELSLNYRLGFCRARDLERDEMSLFGLGSRFVPNDPKFLNPKLYWIQDHEL